ncbi:hypothetical protein SAMN04488038_105264 [Solimonas aquatica]|uniref:Lipoprotein n=1 Tax=Solimonas aquatica TaxID=489703 RepID=A0A1H9F658_9GAMM|nr:hypothetical protein [Solimonas aquatica]SEQ33357.1 hypothetical protein SAMN04488038_105264 [Solimonas aquatica]
MPATSRSHHRWPLLLVALLLGACSSGFIKVTPPPGNYVKLGAARGEACGTNVLLIPIGLNERLQNAYDQALASVPNARALIDVTMQERWFFWGLGTMRCTSITAVAVR